MPGSVGVVIPVRNGAVLLGQALASVRAQGWEALDVVVVDDGSTDGSGDVARASGGARVLRLETAGAGAARNLGATAVTGDFLAFLDADDRWTPGSLAVRMEAFTADPRLGLVYGRVREFIDDPVGCVAPRGVAAAPIPSAVVIRRAEFVRSGGFGTAFAGAEAVEWYTRVLDAGTRTRAVDAVVCERRIHRGHAGRPAAQDAYLRAVRAALGRRRPDLLGPAG